MDGLFAQGVYIGNFAHNLDARNRVTVPSNWRVVGDEGNFYFGWPDKAGCISVMPPHMLQGLLEKSRDLKQQNLATQAALRRFFGKGTQFGCDKQGRILLSEPLLKHAGITKQVVMVGLGLTFQIWNPERYDEADAAFDVADAGAELEFF
jgi:MraZ protein